MTWHIVRLTTILSLMPGWFWVIVYIIVYIISAYAIELIKGEKND